MDKYKEMKSCSNCFNAGEIKVDLPNLFCYKLCLSLSNDHINNLKDYINIAEENKQDIRSDSKHDTTHKDVTGMSQLQKEDSSHLFIKLTLLRYKSSITTSRD